MPNRDELIALAERCEAATGPDRALDATIVATVRIGTEHEWAYKHPAWISDSSGRVHLEKNGPSFSAAAYTASLDAAMTLVPEGWLTERATQDFDGAEWHWSIYPAFKHGNRVWGQAGSAPLALAAASLRAHAEIAKLNDVGEG